MASAVDLVRFAPAFDDPATCPILSSSSVTKLFAEHEYGNSQRLHHALRMRLGGPPNRSMCEAVARRQHRGTGARLLRWQDSTTGGLFCSAVLFNRDTDATLLELVRTRRRL